VSDELQPRPRTAEEWKAIGRVMARTKALGRQQRESFVVGVGCVPMLLASPLLAVLWGLVRLQG
jgi:hypothetical protein